VVDHDRRIVGICLNGGHGGDADDKSGNHVTLAQARSRRALIADIRSRTQSTKVSSFRVRSLNVRLLVSP
jgi:hypothetical protein